MDWKIRYGPRSIMGATNYIACENLGDTLVYFSLWHTKPPSTYQSIVAVFKLKGTK